MSAPLCYQPPHHYDINESWDLIHKFSALAQLVDTLLLKTMYKDQTTN